MQVALGAVYAWSVFRVPLTQQFGWSASEIDGHDVGALAAAIERVPDGSGQPVAGGSGTRAAPPEAIPVLDVETVRQRASSCGAGL